MIGRAAEILRSWTTTTRRREIHGVTITCRSVSESSWQSWETLLRTWLPRFEDAGWLDGLNAIHIDKSRLRGNNEGQYDWIFQNIILKPSPRLSEGYSVSTNREEVLIHEMAHHAHRKQIGVFKFGHKESVFPSYQHDFEQYVSEYAGTNMYEAVAEMATGSVKGNEYPSRLHRAYEELNGPKGISALRQPEGL